MTAGYHAGYSRLVMKALQPTPGGRVTLTLFLALVPMTSTPGAHSAAVVAHTVSSAGDIPEQLLRSGVFDDVDEVNQRATPLASAPTSPSDDRLRWLTFYLIYTDAELSRYAPGGAMGARFDMFQFAGFPDSQPIGYPIHIVVRDASTRLVGVVCTRREKQIAEARAREAAGVLGVENALTIAHQEDPR